MYAHPNPKSFCYAILQQFTKGLEGAGHVSEVVDLYAIHFDPVFSMEDFAGYLHESMPPEILEEMNLKRYVLDAAGGPIQRFIAERWLRDKDDKAVARFIHAHKPKDVRAQWEKLANLDGICNSRRERPVQSLGKLVLGIIGTLLGIYHFFMCGVPLSFIPPGPVAGPTAYHSLLLGTAAVATALITWYAWKWPKQDA